MAIIWKSITTDGSTIVGFFCVLALRKTNLICEHPMKQLTSIDVASTRASESVNSFPIEKIYNNRYTASTCNLSCSNDILNDF